MNGHGSKLGERALAENKDCECSKRYQISTTTLKLPYKRAVTLKQPASAILCKPSAFTPQRDSVKSSLAGPRPTARTSRIPKQSYTTQETKKSHARSLDPVYFIRVCIAKARDMPYHHPQPVTLQGPQKCPY